MTLRKSLRVHRSFPGWLFRHASLSPSMREGLDWIIHEEAPALIYQGLCILVEGVLANTIEGLHRHHPGNAIHEGVGLCAALLHTDQGFGPGEIEKGREYLAQLDKLTANSLLTFYLRLRKQMRDTQTQRAWEKHQAQISNSSCANENQPGSTAGSGPLS